MNDTRWAIISTEEAGFAWESSDEEFMRAVFYDIQNDTNTSGEFSDGKPFIWQGDLLLVEIHGIHN